MRLYLLPISTRRALLYAQRLNVTTTTNERNLVDKSSNWAAKKWAQWESMEKGWQRKVVDYGNQAFRRIPYEEWGLKSVPPLSARRRAEEIKGNDKVELVFPAAVLAVHKVEGLVMKMATERQALHRKRLIWSVVGMPLTAPFAIVPVIPNLPFFYLVYRAWSHWKAIKGGKHVQWLVKNKLLQPSPSKQLDQLYTINRSIPPTEEPSGKERILLTREQAREFSKTLDLPPLEVELERAIWQVNRALRDEELASKEETNSETTSEEGIRKQEKKE